MEPPRLVAVGRIGRAHGVRGLVKVLPYGDSLAEQRIGDRLELGPSARGTDQAVLTIAALQPHGNQLLLMQFEEITTRDEAEKLLGREVFLPPERLSRIAEGEFYHYQLLGLAVVTTTGLQLGQLTGIIETGSNDVYVVERDGKEVLIPALEGVIVSVDVTMGQMIVELPEGLIDDL
jgi:16S rRNA processing protein RimM